LVLRARTVGLGRYPMTPPREAAPTSRPWYVDEGTNVYDANHRFVAECDQSEFAELIVSAVNAYDPEALARLTAENVRLRAALDECLNVLIGCVVPGPGVDDRAAMLGAQAMARAALAGTP
jgi:hypothetical protein